MNFNTTVWVKQTLVVGAVLFSSTIAYATDSLQMNLNDVIHLALQNSKYIEQAKLDVKQKNNLVDQKRNELLPKISLRGSASYATNMPIFDRGIFHKPSQHDVIHYLYDTGADLYLNIYNGHRDRMQIKSQQLVKEIAQIDWLAATASIKMDICNLFLDLSLLYNNKLLIQHDIKDQKEQLKEVQHLYKAGTILHSDVLRIELELSKREMLLLKINNDIASTTKKIQLITGVEYIIIPIKHVIDKTLLDYNLLLREAKEQAFILQKSEQEVKLKKIAIQQAKSNYLPQLGFTSTYTFANPQIFLYPYNASWYSLGIFGLKLSVPISTYYTNKKVVQEAEILYKKEKIKHHHEMDGVESQVLQAYLNYQLAIEQRDVCIKNVELAKENVRILKNRYFKSAALVTDLLDADIQYLETLFDLEAAAIAIQKHYYFIEFLKGSI